MNSKESISFYSNILLQRCEHYKIYRSCIKTNIQRVVKIISSVSFCGNWVIFTASWFNSTPKQKLMLVTSPVSLLQRLATTSGAPFMKASIHFSPRVRDTTLILWRAEEKGNCRTIPISYNDCRQLHTHTEEYLIYLVIMSRGHLHSFMYVLRY